MRNKKEWKKILALGLSIGMTVSLAACGQKETGQTAQVGQEESDQKEEESSAQAGPAEETAEGPAWKNNTDPVDLTWFVGASWYPYSWGDSLVSKNITEKTGVNIEIQTPTGDVNEELSLLMISGDMPDLISLGSWESSYNKLYEGGYVYALNELADQYDPYFYQVVDGSVIKWHTKEDGNLYCIPNDAYGEEQMAQTGMTAATQTFLVRKDLYEDMGSPDLTTPEGFLEALRKLKNEYSTYKGEPITPFYAQGGTGYGLSSFLQNLLAVPYEKDGVLYDRLTDPDYIEWLKTFRQAYEEGLMGIDYMVDSEDQVTEKANNGRYFCMIREWSGMQEANTILAQSENPDSYYIAVAGPSNAAKDNPLIFPGSLDGWMSCFISKNCENPDRAIAFLTYLSSEEGQRDMFLGVEGETYDVIDGKPALKQEYIDMMTADFDTFSNEYGLCDTYWMLRNSVIVDQWRPASEPYIQQMKDWANSHAFIEGGIYNNLDPTGESDAAIAITRINQKWEEVLPELITAPSDEEFDRIFGEFLESRDSYGYDLVVEYKQNLLNERREKMSE